MTEPSDPTIPPAYGSPPPAAPPAYGAPPPPYGAPPAYSGVNQPYGAPYYGAPSAPAPGAIAPMGLRLVARIVDGVLIYAVTIALAYAFGIKVFNPTSTTNPDGTTTHSAGLSLYGGTFFAVLGIGAVIGILYEVVMIAQRGATLGKSAAGIKVVRGQEGAIPGYPASFRRWILPALANFIFSLIALLIYVSPFFDNTGRRQGWHDKFANTFVIRR